MILVMGIIIRKQKLNKIIQQEIIQLNLLCQSSIG